MMVNLNLSKSKFKGKTLFFFLIIYSCCFFSSCTESKGNGRITSSFNKQWKFSLSDDPTASDPEFDDDDWRSLNLPHDWAIEGEFSDKHPSGIGGGALPGGVGWYRKNFDYKLANKENKLFIDFDGVYMNSEVFINGKLLGKRPYGYISFRYDLTPYLNENGNNLIAVRVDNKEQPNSRWYSGCGIYRNVKLTEVSPIHVDLWGIKVTTPEVSKESATISIETTIKNNIQSDFPIIVKSVLYDKKGIKVGEFESLEQINTNKIISSHNITLSNPHLWSPDDPYLYTLKTIVYNNGIVVDNIETPTGIRSFHFDHKEGMILNGKPTKINGVCMHHDLGCLGAAINVRAMERQLEILKEMGCNGIRTAHNPPAPELLDLCDQMGFIVMDETFDMWSRKKTKHDYSRYFAEWHERDLTDLILRDRNHPSIFMWSIGNEVLEQWPNASADNLTIEEANLILNLGHELDRSSKGEMNVNSILCTKLANMVKELDPTRPVTAGCNEPDPDNNLFRSGSLDIIGYNYQDSWFTKVPENFPGKPFIVTESVSALMTRGYYRMPSDMDFLWPERWDKDFYDETFSCSSYDHCRTPWGNRHEGTMRHLKNNKFISGQYVWTGFDYIGEPTPFGWPARSSFFGIIDLAGFPKDVYYMYQAEWNNKDVLHLFPHWNWKDGQDIDLWAYYNNADEVELFVNGVSQGVKNKGIDDFHVMWRVKYTPGTIKAVSRKNGKIVKEHEIKTAGEPHHIRLSADRNMIDKDGKDLSFITVSVHDKDGNICPNADHLINFDVKGVAYIAGVDNGNPTSLESFKTPFRKVFNGKALVVLQNDGTRGTAVLTASSEKLESAKIKIEAL